MKIPQNAGDFRLISRRVADALDRCHESNRYMRGLIAWLGFEQTGVEYERRPRVAGESKAPIGSLIVFTLNALHQLLREAAPDVRLLRVPAARPQPARGRGVHPAVPDRQPAGRHHDADRARAARASGSTAWASASSANTSAGPTRRPSAGRCMSSRMPSTSTSRRRGPMPKGSDVIARFLVEQGVESVFELVGGMIVHLLDSIHHGRTDPDREHASRAGRRLRRRGLRADHRRARRRDGDERARRDQPADRHRRAATSTRRPPSSSPARSTATR